MSRIFRPSLVGLLLLGVACTSNSLGKFNTPPSASIVTPVDGALLPGGTPVELAGLANDPQEDPTSLLVQWSLETGEIIAEDPPDASGAILQVVPSFPEGDHVLSLKVFDSEGDSAVASVAVSVGEWEEEEEPDPGTPPQVLIASPGDGEEFVFGQTVTLIGAASDAEDPAENLLASFSSLPDGLLWEGPPAADGRVELDVSDLSIGTHTITLAATDSDGRTAQDDITLTILDDGRPRVTIESPLEGDSFLTTDTVVFRGTASDLETETEALGISWDSNIQGNLMVGSPDSSGTTLHSANLVEGIHIITLTATDSDGQTGSRSHEIEVIDPNNIDDDRDGYSENEGDCDDGDGSISPGRSEICDDIDDNCDGIVNETWWDAYEPNESSGAPYDLGTVGGSFWSGSTATISGLKLHAAADQDWFVFDADDNSFLTLRINVTAGAFSSSGYYILELWSFDGTPRRITSTAGSGSLSLTWTQDLFEDEDLFGIVVYPSTWPNNCTANFTLMISTSLGV